MVGIPKVRFKGFIDVWEQRKLGNIALYRRGSFPQPYGKKEWYDGDGAMPFVQVADVSDSMNLIEDTKQKISKLAQLMSVYAEKNSVLVTLQGSIGRVAITQYGAYVDRTVLIFEKYKEKIDNIFWAYIIKQKFIDEARKAPGGTIKTITKEALSEFNLMLPSYEEQKQLGIYLQSLDHLIIFHQRKCDEIKELKKYMLKKMFPQNGKKIPEIRFAGFTDVWKQCKLGEVVTEVKRTDENSDAPVMMIAANEGFINQSERYSNNNAGQSLKKYIVLEKGELAYNHGASKLRPYGSCFVLMTEEKARIPFVYHCFTTHIENAEFLSIILNGKSVERQLRRMVSSSARMDGLLNISFEEYTSISVVLPSVAEQNQIAAYFRNLDYLITLYQRKCDELKEAKKFMLQNMFPQKG